ncbi:winged helix-turn-helix transcriptional regulator [Mesorhizobium sangaii]|uniref:DNA-binding HxlR family transcriptional regulator n=1 Tax=Mesorhizobium sangaii TaxID=505389 RepID=A0A841P3C8_9HYPH|nr:helix-turn-helix domain-containing protein [Mesorhizobium sangaii]MBB6409757.1 DNA-binding HxlR family transcriptional regulator [Mesorhizobium sangaii]
MTQRGRLYGCPVEFALDALGGKWKTVILARIKQQPLRYSELRRTIPSLSDKMLTQRLADLVDIGASQRTRWCVERSLAVPRTSACQGEAARLWNDILHLAG